MSVIGDDETMQIKVEPVLHGSAVDFGDEAARRRQRRAVEPHPVTHRYRAATRDGHYGMAAGLTGGHTLAWVRRMVGRFVVPALRPH